MVVEDKTTPSGSRFEQGRGRGWLGTRDGPCDSRFGRGRGRVRWWKTRPPPPACVSSKGGVGVVGDKRRPLRLAFRAREG